MQAMTWGQQKLIESSVVVTRTWKMRIEFELCARENSDFIYVLRR